MASTNLDSIFDASLDAIIDSKLPKLLLGCDMNAIERVVHFLRHKLYVAIDPRSISGTLSLRLAPSGASPRGTQFADLNALTGEAIETMALELHDNGRLYDVTGLFGSVEAESANAVVYMYANKTDTIWFSGTRSVIPALNDTADSQFSGNTFFFLAEAIREYAHTHALNSTCFILQGAWHDDGRLFLRARPEAPLRNSLKQFLANRLAGGFSVELEQNVDGSHPVDIRVIKELKPRLMLVEVKWIGDSVNEAGTASTVSYRDQRAIDGANQLATYIDAQRSQVGHVEIVGYYVIFDARRKGLKFGQTTYPEADLRHYRDKEILFGDLASLKRFDVETPFRIYMEPKIGVVGSKAGKV